jgi:2-amino-4-hydroxy-6-hydroxymethyldihydropteridine diphosphokinase
VTAVYLGLGSNVGDRQAHLDHAVARLSGAGAVTGLSAVHETDPVGYSEQPRFLNMAVRLETELDPMALLELIFEIEAERGRVRTFRNAPRTLDIDVLLYGDLELRLPGLTVPHPRMAERAFVLEPLLEVESDLREPVTGRSYADILAGLKAAHDE